MATTTTNTADRQFFVLLESAAGYCVFEVIQFEEIASLVQEASNVTDLARFGRAVKLQSFSPFSTAAEALENANAVSEHAMTKNLHNVLELNLPVSQSKKSKKKSKDASSSAGNFVLGVMDPALATAIVDGSAGTIPCRSDETVREIIRGCRMHLDSYLKNLYHKETASTPAETGQWLQRATCGLSHAYSRSKVKFNPARSDNMVIQSIALLDQLDKDVNTFAMRVREWYSWHFPELRDLVPDNVQYARVAAIIQNKNRLLKSKPKSSGGGDDDGDDDSDDEMDDDKESSDKPLQDLAQVLGNDEDLLERIVHAAKTSMGMDCSDVDMMNVVNFTTRMVSLAEYRKQLALYLQEKMAIVAPNLSTLVGDTVAARLISKAGSLTNLAKVPASTVQILGAEKALFRALKTKGNTPKYGLLYHSTFVGRAAAKNRGRISRYLANKCSMATRIDSFSDSTSRLYGEKLRDQVEERLQFYETGKVPRRNLDVMEEVAKQLKSAQGGDEDMADAKDDDDMSDASAEKKSKKDKKKKDKKKKRKAEDGVTEEAGESKSAKKAKKEKKKDKKKKSL